MLKTLLLGSLSIAILLLSNGSSGAADLQWTDVLEKCDKIYNTRQKNMPLDVFVTLTGAYEHKGGDGVRYFSSKEGQNKWKGMDLIAAYGVDDCSDASLAFDTQCYPVHPPNVTFIFKTTLAVKIGMSKAGVFAKHPVSYTHLR